MTAGTPGRRFLGPYVVMVSGPPDAPWYVDWLCDVCQKAMTGDGRVLWDATYPADGPPRMANLLSACSAQCSEQLRSTLPEVEWGERDIVQVIAGLALGRKTGDRIAQLIRDARTAELLEDYEGSTTEA